MNKINVMILFLAITLLLTGCAKNNLSASLSNVGQQTNIGFLEDVMDERGNIAITANLRSSFQKFAQNYCWSSLPDMDGYESFFETDHYANSYGYSNFADAVFYVFKYLNTEKALTEKDMQNEIINLFAAKMHYEAMPHQNYPKIATYENGVYVPWIEGELDSNGEFYLLKQLEVRQDENNAALLYITVNVQYYYFNDTSIYEPGEHEKWLAEKAQSMGMEAWEAAYALVVNGEITELAPLKSLETTMVLNTASDTSTKPSFKFLFSHSQ